MIFDILLTTQKIRTKSIINIIETYYWKSLFQKSIDHINNHFNEHCQICHDYIDPYEIVNFCIHDEDKEQIFLWNEYFCKECSKKPMKIKSEVKNREHFNLEFGDEYHFKKVDKIKNKEYSGKLKYRNTPFMDFPQYIDFLDIEVNLLTKYYFIDDIRRRIDKRIFGTGIIWGIDTDSDEEDDYSDDDQ